MRRLGEARDVATIGAAVFAAASRILAVEESAGGTYPTEPLDLPPLDATPAYQRLVERAELDDHALAILRVLVAVELDRDVQRVVRRLSADVAMLGTPVDGVIAALEGLGGDAVALLQALRPTAPLALRGLVTVVDPQMPPLAQHVSVPAAVVDFLVTGKAPAPTAPFEAEIARPLAQLCPVPVRGLGPTSDARDVVWAALANPRTPLWLVGPPRSGRRTLLAAAASSFGKQLVCVAHRDLARLSTPQVVAALWRECLVADAIACIGDVEAVVEIGGADEGIRSTAVDRRLVELARALTDTGLPVAFTSSQSPPTHAFDNALQVVELDPARLTDAVALWERELPGIAASSELATQFRLQPARIVRTAKAAGTEAALQGRAVAAADVVRAVSISVAQQVSVLGSRIDDAQTWSDVILHADTLASVREMIARVRHRHTVLERWGFRDKLAKGLGVASLFHGPPGTGKTMVANLIAKELGQDLYQVDLSRMVSKWVGETEKNLSKVFDAADGSNVMLLFDEADSLFGKRTEVKSSNDRHANAEVNYLLQRVERFEGVCILTTNAEKSIDAAFKRRLAFRVEFPMPDETERRALWKRMIPKAAAVAPDVDFHLLADNYELSGGNIRNAVVRAAFLAADAGSPISMDVLHRAVKLEYRDAGKLGTSGAIHT